jgi:hypothetical protein
MAATRSRLVVFDFATGRAESDTRLRSGEWHETCEWGPSRKAMLDLLFVVLMLAGFGVCFVYTVACERL